MYLCQFPYSKPVVTNRKYYKHARASKKKAIPINIVQTQPRDNRGGSEALRTHLTKPTAPLYKSYRVWARRSKLTDECGAKPRDVTGRGAPRRGGRGAGPPRQAPVIARPPARADVHDARAVKKQSRCCSRALTRNCSRLSTSRRPSGSGETRAPGDPVIANYSVVWNRSSNARAASILYFFVPSDYVQVTATQVRFRVASGSQISGYLNALAVNHNCNM